MLFGKREGYLLVDHSASPGLTEEQARQAGFDPALVKEGKRYEAATLTCSHCKTTVVKNPWRTRERSSCVKCGNHFVCDSCGTNMRSPDYSHLPFEKLVDLTLSGKSIPPLLLSPTSPP